MRAYWVPVVALVLAASCSQKRKEVVVPDTCRHDPPAWNAGAGAAESARHVVRARVRWTGSVNDEDGREFPYVIADVLDFQQGDPWAVHPRYRRSFPLLGDPAEPAALALIARLACRQGEAFLFHADLPGIRDEPPVRAPPAPILRAFGKYRIRLHAVVPTSG
jgi:hypothetical protein